VPGTGGHGGARGGKPPAAREGGTWEPGTGSHGGAQGVTPPPKSVRVNVDAARATGKPCPPSRATPWTPVPGSPVAPRPGLTRGPPVHFAMPPTFGCSNPTHHPSILPCHPPSGGHSPLHPPHRGRHRMCQAVGHPSALSHPPVSWGPSLGAPPVAENYSLPLPKCPGVPFHPHRRLYPATSSVVTRAHGHPLQLVTTDPMGSIGVYGR